MAPCGCPASGGVATGALGRREPGRDVIWNRATHGRGAVVLILVTAIAIGVGRGERIVVVDMAGRTGGRSMDPSERPTGGAVVKRRGSPRNCIVAR